MSMPSRSTTDNSVTISLAELAKIEEQRVREEQAERVRAREQHARAGREAEANRRAREAAEIAAAEQARAHRAREDAIEKARSEARQRAAADVARIEAEARARLEADNAVRAHELEMLRVRRQIGRRRREIVISVVLALFVCAGAIAGQAASTKIAALERTIAELRDGNRALGQEREDAKRTDLDALERRYDALLARPHAKSAGDARATAQAARSAIDERSPGHDRLRAFADALDGLEARIEYADKLAALERRDRDLGAWAASIRRTQATAAAKSAAARAKAPGAGASELVAYERALDQLRETLAPRASASGRPSASEPTSPGHCPQGDPDCGLDGRPLF